MSTIIFDPGTANWKMGPAGETLPACVMPVVVGVPSKTKSLLKRNKTEDEDGADGSNKVAYGEDALHNASRCQLAFPTDRGVVTNWDQAEGLFAHMLKEELQIEDVDGSRILIAVPPYNPTENTERFAAMCMETFNMEKIAVQSSGLCALYASSRFTGLVLDSGEGMTTVQPLYDSFPLTRAVNRLNWGGADVTRHLTTLMYEKGFSFSSRVDEWQVRLIKEKLAYVAENYPAELEKDATTLAKSFDLPDGQEIEVSTERFRCAEILFKPSIVHEEKPSLSDFVAQTIKQCDIDLRKDLSSNIVLSGGNTLFPGFRERLQTEVANRFPGMFGHVNVIAPPDRQNLVWMGGSVIASIDSFEPLWVTREVYEEHGPSVVHGYRRKDNEDEEYA